MTNRKLVDEPKPGKWIYTDRAVCLGAQVCLCDDTNLIHFMTFKGIDNAADPQSVILMTADEADRLAMQLIDAARYSRGRKLS